ncbi:MAG: tetratricopeptide repeat protein [Salibacteraceae bacterium]
MRVLGICRWFVVLVTTLLLLSSQTTYAQDDILDEIEAELRKEEEQKKAQEKANKNKEKFAANYQASVRKGDALLRAQKYDDAIEAYTEAKKWGPSEAYPDQQLNKAKEEKTKAEEAEKAAELDAEYKAIISKADAYFKGQKYNEAIGQYEEAVKVKSDEVYPKDQIGEAKKAIAKQEEEKKLAAQQAELDKKYNEAMASGDAAMKSKDFDGAINSYSAASKLKPTEADPKSRMATAEKMKADEAERLKQEETQKKYDDLISEADNLLKASKFDEAKAKYEAASHVLPHETYPKTKMKECDDTKLAAAQAEQRAQYDALISEGDDLLKAENFDEAIAKYQAAAPFQPHESHPKDMITQVENLKAQKAKDQKLANYEKILKEAEELIHQEKFDEGITKLKEAHKAMPEENKTNELIAEAEKLKLEKANKAIQDQYDSKLKEGEELMHAGNYDPAIEKFKEAKLILNSDHRADNLIEQVNTLKADKEQQAKMESFNTKLKEGEKLLAENRFDEAIAAFEAAQKIIPTETKPKTLIAQTNEIRRAKEKEIAKQEFDDYISKGDQALETGDFAKAKSDFKAALGVYAEGQSTVDARLAKVETAEKLKAEADANAAAAAAKEDQFNKLLAEADAHLAAKELEQAKKKVENAQLLFPNDKNAKSKAAEIETLILAAEKEKQEKLAQEALAKEQAEKEAQVTDFVSKANSAQASGELNQAKNYIASALSIIPDDANALAKQKEIETAIIAEEEKLVQDKAAQEAAQKASAEKKAKIDALNSKADGQMSKGLFEAAIATYDEVLAIDASNNLATSKKQEAQKGIEKRKEEELAAASAAEKEKAEAEKQAQIEQLLSEGDKALKGDDFEVAKERYQAVLALDNTNTRAQSKLQEVDNATAQANAAKLAAEKAAQEKLAAQNAAQIEADRLAKIKTLKSEAEGAEKSEDLDGAISKWTEIRTLDSENSDAQSNITRLNNKKKELAAAASLAADLDKKQKEEAAKKQAEEQRLASIQNLSNEAEDLENKGDLKNALAKWKEVLAIDATINIASANVSRLEKRIAKEEEERLAKIEADKNAALEAERLKAAQNKEKAEADKKAKIESLTASAQSSEKTENYDAAISQWNEIIALEEGNSLAIAGLSRSKQKKKLQEENEFKAAEAQRRKAERDATLKSEQEKKQLIASYLETGDKILAEKQYSRAIENYKKAEALDSENSEIKSRIERAKSLKKEEDKRINQLETAERQKEISLLLSDAKLLSIKRNYKESGTKYDKVLEFEPNNSQALEGKAAIQKYLDEIAIAEAKNDSQRKAEEEKQRKVEAILDAGSDFYAGGEYAKAIAKYKEGLELDPLNEEVKSSIRNASRAQDRAEQYRIAKLHNKPRPRAEGFKTEQLTNEDIRMDKTAFQNELGKAYPEGVTEEQKKGHRKVVTRKVVVKEGNGTEYFKVRHDWGGVYYFKNGESITPYLFQYGTRNPDQITN